MRGGGSESWQEQPQLLIAAYPPNVPSAVANNSKAQKVDDSSSQQATNLRSESYWSVCSLYYQHLLDRSTPHTVGRWLFFLFVMACYAFRISLIHSHHIITYAYAIYLLSLLIGFLTPKMDPAWSQILREELEEEEDSNGGLLPNSAHDEFRPFMRRLPEFRCWLNATRATLIAFMCTLTRVFDVPVFWPILVVYFVMLFMLTMKRQIAHMLRYRYLPFSIGKQRYKERPQAPPAADGSVHSAGKVIHS